LENLLHRAMALSDGHPLEMDAAYSDSTPAALAPETVWPLDTAEVAAPVVNAEISDTGASEAAPIVIPSDLQSHLDAQERDILVRVLSETRFNRTAAAQRLGISLRQIRYRMERLRIDVPGEDRDKAP
jgi:two-component system response regulator PilR (NtrC family)